MKIVYFSKGTRGSRCLAHVLDAGYQVAAVVATGQESDLDALAERGRFPILISEKPNSRRFVEELQGFQPDLFVLCGYNRILKSRILSVPPLGTINLHGGKLPDYRGAAPINWQIINGETSGGCSILYVDEGIDTGGIIAEETYRIEADDTHASVLEKTLAIFPPLLVEVLRKIEDGTVTATAQDPLAGRYYTRRYPRDSLIRWPLLDDVQVHNLVRAMHGPYPAAYSFRGGSKVEIDRTRLLQETIKGTPGRIPLKRGKQVVVLARNRGLLIEKITVDGQDVEPAEFFKIGDDLTPVPHEEGIE
jgi:methionyl-tRNA formyltransferase